MEFLDVVDEQGNPTGETVERSVAHSKGIRHRTSHVWLVRRHCDEWQVLLQKRQSTKDINPDCYDISSAGHIPAGVDFLTSALRELKEELGVEAAADELHVCGSSSESFCREFHGRTMRENEVSRVFCTICTMDEQDFELQAEEVSAVKWIPVDECVKGVAENAFPNCIALHEITMIRDFCHKMTNERL